MTLGGIKQTAYKTKSVSSSFFMFCTVNTIFLYISQHVYDGDTNIQCKKNSVVF